MTVSENDTSIMPEADKEPMHYGSFPDGFLFGSVTVAHQVEGSSEGDGKGLSIWDEFSHSHPKCIADRTVANETTDSYNRFMEDVIILKYLNANSYSFTLSWPRIFPEGLPTKINQKGINYYDDVINTLLENGIEPVVTLYHWDLPLSLIKKYAGGWMNDQLLLAFEAFARICFKKFGDRVKHWITIANPWEHSWKSYGSGAHPPNLCLGSRGALIANTNMLKAHAKVYRLYQDEFKLRQQGKVGISVGCDDNEDKLIQQLTPVLYPLTHGEYPKAFTSNSEEIRERFCPPALTEEWRSCIRGSFDFLNLSYSSRKSHPSSESESLEMRSTQLTSSALPFLLKTVKTEFGNPEIFISCEGPSLQSPFQMMDMDRAQYFTQMSSDILKAIELDQCNIKGFFPGKLMDCWEWEYGYTISYGLFHVDMNQPTKKRSPRASVAFMLKQLFKEKKLQDVFPL